MSKSLKACVIKLASIQAQVEIAEPFRKGPCGAPAAIQLKKLGTRYPLRLSPPATLRCSMAVALYRFVEESLQPAAIALLGSPVVSFQGISSYSCRNRNGSKNARLSEHALANALDVGTFQLANGRTVKVLSDWGATARDLAADRDARQVAADHRSKSEKTRQRLVAITGKRVDRRRSRSGVGSRRRPLRAPPLPIKKSVALNAGPKEPAVAGQTAALPEQKPGIEKPKPVGVAKKLASPPPPTKEMLFLKRVHKEACKYFGTVLGPEANEAHRDHFHFDLAPRKRSNYCQ